MISVNAQDVHRRARACASSMAHASGFTLLEVLVACGIIVLALSGIAAMLPAASSRLADAAVQDRAGATAANARSELEARGFIAAEWFRVAGADRKALAVGRPLEPMNSLGKLLEDSIKPYDMKELWLQSDARGSFSEDDLEFQLTPSGSVASLYEAVNGLGFPTRPRRFKPGVCWGAMLIPESLALPATKGLRATLAIAVFRKIPEGRLLALTSTSSGSSKTGLYRLSRNETTIQSAFARACSYVLLLPPAINSLPPKWARVNSSWSVRDQTSANQSDRMPFVMFSDDPNQLAGYEKGGVLTAVGFSSLLRVDEFPVVLE